MRVLALCARFPYPFQSGLQLRDFNILSRLSGVYELHLCSFVDHLPTPEAIEALSFCRDIHTVVGGLKSVRSVIKNLFELTPYHVTSFRSQEMQAKVLEKLWQHHFDIIYLSPPFLIQYIPDGFQGLRVLDQQNVESMMWRRRAKYAVNPLVRMISRFTYLKMKRYERLAYKKVDLCFSVSDQDATLTKEFAPESVRVELAPNGVDVEYFRPNDDTAERKNTILLSGGMVQIDTEDAAIRFCNQILPIIREYIPEVRCWLVGREPTKAVRSLARDPMVTVTGTVDDVRPYYEQAFLVVAPYRIGGGTKLKIANAMAMGKAVVATPIGAQGFDFKPDEICIVPDDDALFAEKTIYLLKHPDIRQRMGKKAREAVVNRYNWDNIVDRMIQVIQTFASNTKNSKTRRI